MLKDFVEPDWSRKKAAYQDMELGMKLPNITDIIYKQKKLDSKEHLLAD